MITGIEVENLRAYRRLSLELKEGINFLVGPNAVGKTSLLEAISLALVGEPQTVGDPAALMREQASLSRVKVTFVHGGTVYVVERNLRPEGTRGHCYLQEGDGRRVSQRWDELTGRVEEIFGTSAAFFKRIIYMAEGDISRFVAEPPGAAVMSQIDRLLGIDQLEASKEAVRAALKYAAGRIEQCEGLLTDYDEQAKGWVLRGEQYGADEPLAALERLEARISHLETTLQMVGERKAGASQSVQELEELQAHLARVTQVLGDDATLRTVDIPVADLVSQRLQVKASEVQSLEKAVGELQESVGRLKGRKEAREDALRLLKPSDLTAEDTSTIPCPVCRKPLSHEERKQILGDVEEEILVILGEQRDTEAELAREDTKRAAALADMGTLEEYSRRTTEWAARYPAIQSPTAAHEKAAALKNDLRRADDESAERRHQLKTLRDASSALSALSQKVESLGFASLAAARQGLVGLTKAELVLEASRRAIEQTVAEQRDQNLQEVYQQIAEAWQTFVQRSEWTVEFESDGRPSVCDVDQERTFDLRQLSGGEKTALLAIMHSVLASRFSEARFMMIDEPLEHLDVVNRRSLVRFFVEALKKGFFEQMVVTTFEESLVRKYLSEPGVNVVYLDAYRPEVRLLAQESA